MSAISSLSVWSSIKIPLPVYSGKNRNQTKSSVPYIDTWKVGNQIPRRKSKKQREVVNLIVPTSLTENKKNFQDANCTYPVIRVRTSQYVQPQNASAIAKSPVKHFRRGYRKAPKSINSLWVPHTSDFDTTCNPDLLENRHNSCEDYDDLCQNLNFDENMDTGMKTKYIPSVKPCTTEELRVFNRRFQLKEEKIKAAAEKKKRNKSKVKITKSDQTPKTPNKPFCLDSYRSHESFSQNFCCNDKRSQDSVALLESTGRNYYNTKLAELYMIELGIKR